MDNRIQILRSIDKLDRIGVEGVRLLLTTGRRDESGDFTPGCGLEDWQADTICDFLQLAVWAKDSSEESRAKIERFCHRQKAIAALSNLSDEDLEDMDRRLDVALATQEANSSHPKTTA